jgi:putative CocE/NonD family hydrolase
VLRLALASALGLATFVALGAGPPKSESALDRLAREFRLERHVTMAMRDGVRLYGHALFPLGDVSPRGTVLIRSPYELAVDEASEREAAIRTFLRRGHVVVLQNERGRYFSEGRYRTMIGAKEDGKDTLDWIIAQPWSNGRVATYGCSSSAENQLKLATINHPAHVAAVLLSPAVAIDRVGDIVEHGQVWRGGAFQQDWIPWFHDYGHLQWPQVFLAQDPLELKRYVESFELRTTSKIPGDWPARARGFPQVDAMVRLGGPLTEFEGWLRRPINDPAWSENLVSDDDDIDVPSLWMTSWFDYAPHLAIELFEVMRSRRAAEGRASQKLIVAPGLHCSFETERHRASIGDQIVRNATLDYLRIAADWIDAYITNDAQRRSAVEAWPAVQSHTLGAHRWNSYSRWPPEKAAPRRLHFASRAGHRAGGRTGALLLAPTSTIDNWTIESDPLNPVPTRGGGGYPRDLGDNHPLGSVDQASVEKRSDVLVFTTPKLEQDWHLVGRVRLQLSLSVDAPDADVTAKLVRVNRRGRSFNIADTVLRLRYRGGFEAPALLVPGERVRVTLPMMAVDTLLRRDERLGIQIAASNWPKFSINSQDGNVPETSPSSRKARLTIATGGDNLSWVEFQVMSD